MSIYTDTRPFSWVTTDKFEPSNECIAKHKRNMIKLLNNAKLRTEVSEGVKKEYFKAELNRIEAHEESVIRAVKYSLE